MFYCLIILVIIISWPNWWPSTKRSVWPGVKVCALGLDLTNTKYNRMTVNSCRTKTSTHAMNAPCGIRYCSHAMVHRRGTVCTCHSTRTHDFRPSVSARSPARTCSTIGRWQFVFVCYASLLRTNFTSTFIMAQDTLTESAAMRALLKWPKL
jgi:hypothetical protein